MRGYRQRSGESDRPRNGRATSAVVGVVLLVGLTVLLTAVAGAYVGFEGSLADPTPKASFDGSLSAADGWPDGQRLRVVHGGGPPLSVADLALVVEIPRADARARLVDFPTRRLTGDHVRGASVFDETHAGIDGELDGAHTDGEWTAGEAVELRVAQRAVDLRAGDRLNVRIVHRPTGGPVGTLEVTAT